MKDFQNKTAVVTGAASGIGKAVAKICANLQMNLVLADIEEEPLLQFERELKAGGVNALAVVTDVSDESAIDNLANQTLAAFGEVHLLFNNAGVGVFGTVWETSPEDWDWVMGVNLNSVVYAVRRFVPVMLAQNTDCHIINTASLAGLNSYMPSAVYQVSKHGVVALSEHLYHTLSDTRIAVSVVCPGWVNTNIGTSGRNRPQSFGPTATDNDNSDAVKKVQEDVLAGLPPEKVADIIFDGIREQKLYILTHPELSEKVLLRAQNIVAGRNPEPAVNNEGN